MDTSAVATNLDLISQKTNPATGKADQDRKKLADDFDDFLLMLTTQLKHQDPTEPLDTNQFTQQLVMFASVEQQVATNTNMEKMVNLFESQGIDTATSYIGKMVEAKGDGGFLNNGVAPFVYSLPSAAEKVNVVITDASGRAVFSGKGTTNAGKNLVTWDGKNSFTGAQMSEGTYRLQIQATGFDGKTMEATTFTTGYVSAVEMDGGELKLTVGNLLVPVKDVIAIRQTPEGLDAASDEEEKASNDTQQNSTTPPTEDDEQEPTVN